MFAIVQFKDIKILQNTSYAVLVSNFDQIKNNFAQFVELYVLTQPIRQIVDIIMTYLNYISEYFGKLNLLKVFYYAESIQQSENTLQYSISVYSVVSVQWWALEMLF
ncbi:Hypothetical_protein [Hexamita inflata]|uniref:Hypothetical_protein n=1 Tax=Hexamita inflata TaxID=28002 RepID=A0AA86QUU1_9EUKA|nr:Hypothetical protein HINF_LOCUS54109 [Hexamita inflata]